MRDNPALRQAVQAAATADVAQLGGKLGDACTGDACTGDAFSGDALLRMSTQNLGRVTVTRQDIPGEYN